MNAGPISGPSAVTDCNLGSANKDEFEGLNLGMMLRPRRVQELMAT